MVWVIWATMVFIRGRWCCSQKRDQLISCMDRILSSWTGLHIQKNINSWMKSEYYMHFDGKCLFNHKNIIQWKTNAPPTRLLIDKPPRGCRRAFSLWTLWWSVHKRWTSRASYQRLHCSNSTWTRHALSWKQDILYTHSKGQNTARRM